MARLVKVDLGYINPEMVRAIFPGPEGSRIAMTTGPEIMCSLRPDDLAKLFDPPPEPFPDDDITF